MAPVFAGVFLLNRNDLTVGNGPDLFELLFDEVFVCQPERAKAHEDGSDTKEELF